MGFMIPHQVANSTAVRAVNSLVASRDQSLTVAVVSEHARSHASIAWRKLSLWRWRMKGRFRSRSVAAAMRAAVQSTTAGNEASTINSLSQRPAAHTRRSRIAVLSRVVWIVGRVTVARRGVFCERMWLKQLLVRVSARTRLLDSQVRKRAGQEAASGKRVCADSSSGACREEREKLTAVAREKRESEEDERYQPECEGSCANKVNLSARPATDWSRRAASASNERTVRTPQRTGVKMRYLYGLFSCCDKTRWAIL